MTIRFIHKNSYRLLLTLLCVYQSPAASVQYGSPLLEASEKLGQVIDKVVARVNQYPILESELETEYQIYASQRKATNLPTKCELLENMIIHKILLHTASKQEITVKKEEVDTYVSYKIQAILKEVGTEQMLEKYVGKPIPIFKNELRKTIKEQLIAERVRNNIISDVSISPEEVKSFFHNLKVAEIPFFPAKVEAYVLVRYPRINEEGRQQLISQLKDFKLRIQAGEAFSTLAKQYSKDPGSVTLGGDLGFYAIGKLDPVYEKAALSLQVGEISEPVETQFGFHLIQLMERRTGGYHSKHILLKPTFLPADLEKTKLELDSIRTEITTKTITFAEAVKKYSQDVSTASKRGLITEGTEGIQMSVDQLPPDLFFILDGLKPGEISQPIAFTGPTGDLGVRILYLKSRIVSHQAALATDYESIQKLAHAAKRQTYFECWLSKAKQKAIIELNPAYQVCNEK